MKFAKYLQDEAVPEWRKAYINYKHGKQLLKAIERVLDLLDVEASDSENSPLPSFLDTTMDGSDFDSVLGQLLPEEREFFRFLDTQLEKVNNFYREKEAEAVKKLRVIKQQLYVANEWKKRYDDKTAKEEAERGWYVTEWSRVKEGLDDLMYADAPIVEDVTITPSRHMNPYAEGTSTTVGPKPVLRHRDFPAPDGAQNSIPSVNDIVLHQEEQRRQRLDHKVARTRIKAAMYEFYRSLEMIKNYKVLNHTGFAKILKKFDKTAGWRASRLYMNSKLKPAYFMNSTTVEDLITTTEDLFVDTFEKGHRRRGMAKLRIPDSRGQTYHWTTTRIGLYLGLIMPLMVQALQAAFSSDTAIEIPYWHSLLLVYAGLFLTILFACLFGINMYAWSKSRINYKFIFEFDPRDNLDYREYFELPIFFMLLLTLAVYLDFGSKLTAHVATAYWPLILMIVIAAIIFCPLPIANFTSRRWFISTIGRIIASGYYRVEFRDFFIADEMNSLSYSIEQFEFAMCAYSQQWTDLGDTCSTGTMFITPFLVALPPWFRFLQCLRRYRDTQEWFPHLLNAGKYSCSIITLFIAFSYRFYGGSHLRVAYIFMATVTSIYTFVWDVYMDWGLFQFGRRGGGAYGYPFLRQELVYSRIWVYYVAIIMDFVGRFTWMLRLFPLHPSPKVLAFGLALVEVLRRWQWNFFRLENEHLNNCGQFRAIKDIPLPFHIRVKNDTDDDDDKAHARKQSAEDDDEEEDELDNMDYEAHEDTSTEEERYPSFHHPMSSSAPQTQQRPDLNRSSSSQNSFAKFTNGKHAHGLSSLGGPRKATSSTSAYIPIQSTSPPQGNSRNPSNSNGRSLGHRKKSFSYGHIYGINSGYGTDMEAASYSHSNFNDNYQHRRHKGKSNSISNNNNTNNTSSLYPSDDQFRGSRSKSFVEGDTKFGRGSLEILEPEMSNNIDNFIGSTNDKSTKFYGRRDFDARIIDNDTGSSSTGLWNKGNRSTAAGGPSMHGLHKISAGGSSSEGYGSDEQMLGNNRRGVKPQTATPRKRMSVGTRVKSAIFGQHGNSSDEDEDDTE
ncbi:hypothetical protein BGX31_005412 [Mortierella sp. GBA43]|nr:hypothetical protein BGX31_005412 [Mortierella sp. GBA43]